MRFCLRTLSMLLALAGAGSVVYAAISDVEIHVAPKRVDSTSPKNEADNTRTVSKEHWNYEVTVENKTFNPMAAIEVKYIIFFKTEELGSKAPAMQRRQGGSFSIDALKPHDKKTFTTNTVELSKSHLTGNWYYSGGERIKAEDALGGIWVRVYLGGQQLAEYANPSLLMKEKWD